MLNEIASRDLEDGHSPLTDLQGSLEEGGKAVSVVDASLHSGYLMSRSVDSRVRVVFLALTVAVINFENDLACEAVLR